MTLAHSIMSKINLSTSRCGARARKPLYFIKLINSQHNLTQLKSTELSDNAYWSFPPTTQQGTFRALPDDLGKRDLRCNLI